MGTGARRRSLSTAFLSRRWPDAGGCPASGVPGSLPAGTPGCPCRRYGQCRAGKRVRGIQPGLPHNLRVGSQPSCLNSRSRSPHQYEGNWGRDARIRGADVRESADTSSTAERSGALRPWPRTRSPIPNLLSELQGGLRYPRGPQSCAQTEPGASGHLALRQRSASSSESWAGHGRNPDPPGCWSRGDGGRGAPVT